MQRQFADFLELGARDGRLEIENPYLELIRWNRPYDFVNRVMKDSARPTAQEAGELRRMLEPLLEFYKSELVERYPDWGWERKREYKAKADELIDRLRSFTNLVAVRDASSASGWTIEVGPFSGWQTPPQ